MYSIVSLLPVIGLLNVSRRFYDPLLHSFYDCTQGLFHFIETFETGYNANTNSSDSCMFISLVNYIKTNSVLSNQAKTKVTKKQTKKYALLNTTQLTHIYSERL